MKKLSAPFAKFLAMAACALTLGSCNRAEYAQLPKSATYYGDTAHSAATPTSPQQSVAVAPVSPVAAPAPAAPAPAAVTTTAPAATVANATIAAAPASTSTAAKPTFAQRVVLNKLVKKADKMANNLTTAKKSNTASTTHTTALNSNLKLGIILLVVGALVTLLPGGIFSLIGAILAIIGLLFILLAILDMV